MKKNKLNNIPISYKISITHKEEELKTNMEGLIPFVLKAMKKNKLHQHSYKSLSDSSRRSYHLLLAGGEGSSHRRTRSEFQPPSSMDFHEYVQEDMFVRSSSLKKDPTVAGMNSSQLRSRAVHHPNETAQRKWL